MKSTRENFNRWPIEDLLVARAEEKIPLTEQSFSRNHLGHQRPTGSSESEDFSRPSPGDSPGEVESQRFGQAETEEIPQKIDYTRKADYLGHGESPLKLNFDTGLIIAISHKKVKAVGQSYFGGQSSLNSFRSNDILLGFCS